MTLADGLISFAGWWLTLGAGVAAAFLLIGIDGIDEDADGAYAFRPLLIPGILMIWPLVLWRWLRIKTGAGHWLHRYQPPRAVHFPVAILFAAALAFAVVAGLAVRQEWPTDIQPERLSEAGQ